MAKETFTMEDRVKDSISKDGQWSIQKKYAIKDGELNVSKPKFVELNDLPNDIADAIRQGKLAVNHE